MTTKITAYDSITAKEISEYWKEQGFEVKVQQDRINKVWAMIKGNNIAGAKQYIFDTHQEANQVANRLHNSGISSEIIPLENGKYQLKIITGSGKIRELNNYSSTNDIGRRI